MAGPGLTERAKAALALLGETVAARRALVDGDVAAFFRDGRDGARKESDAATLTHTVQAADGTSPTSAEGTLDSVAGRGRRSLFERAVPDAWREAWSRGDDVVDERVHLAPGRTGSTWPRELWPPFTAEGGGEHEVLLPRWPAARVQARLPDPQLLVGMRVKKQHEVGSPAGPSRCWAGQGVHPLT